VRARTLVKGLTPKGLAAAVEFATKLQVRIDEAHQAFSAVAARTPNDGRQGSEALYLIGTALSVGSELPGCSSARTYASWVTELGKLQQQLASDPKEVGVGESQALLALSRIAVRAEYPADRRPALVSALNALDAAMVAGRSADVAAMSNDLDAVGGLLGVSRNPAGLVLNHLRIVVRGGGEAGERPSSPPWTPRVWPKPRTRTRWRSCVGSTCWAHRRAVFRGRRLWPRMSLRSRPAPQA
jgi:hypothetical protein